MRFVDLFAGIGGFHAALARRQHECVYACEIDPQLRAVYSDNFPGTPVYGDIRTTKDKIPPHDLLCAGFPCQPFSKSGGQAGLLDATRGTLFHDILDVLRKHRPNYVILENVGNFERHDYGNTWKTVKGALSSLGYQVRGTEHLTSGGHGLISPHHFGHPHHRERFYVVCSLGVLPDDPFPRGDRNRRTVLHDVVQAERLSPADLRETRLSQQQIDCIDNWNAFLAQLPPTTELPAAPLWADEFGAKYPFEYHTPWSMTAAELARMMGKRPGRRHWSKEEAMSLVPSYARTPVRRFPVWKIRFIRNNREWYQAHLHHLEPGTVKEISRFPPSLRKLEWNCGVSARDLWNCVLQFRPSGLRARPYTAVPALVAMTTTQIPILGPQRRFLTRIEGLRLQGFRDGHVLPSGRGRAFAALGNAVHVDVVGRIVDALLYCGENSNAA